MKNLDKMIMKMVQMVLYLLLLIAHMITHQEFGEKAPPTVSELLNPSSYKKF